MEGPEQCIKRSDRSGYCFHSHPVSHPQSTSFRIESDPVIPWVIEVIRLGIVIPNLDRIWELWFHNQYQSWYDHDQIGFAKILSSPDLTNWNQRTCSFFSPQYQVLPVRCQAVPNCYRRWHPRTWRLLKEYFERFFPPTSLSQTLEDSRVPLHHERREEMMRKKNLREGYKPGFLGNLGLSDVVLLGLTWIQGLTDEDTRSSVPLCESA